LKVRVVFFVGFNYNEHSAFIYAGGQKSDRLV